MAQFLKQILKGKLILRAKAGAKKAWQALSTTSRAVWANIGSRPKKISALLLAFFGSWFLLHTVVIVCDGLTDELGPADVAVVLGSRAYPDGRPSLSLAARLQKGIELYRGGMVRKILVSGDGGEASFHETSVMQDYLLARGIPPEDILVDPAGVNTYASALNTARILAENGWKSVLLVSQYFHLTRAKLAFAKAGMAPVYSAHAPLLLRKDPYSLLREFAGYYVYLAYPGGG